MFLTLLLFYGSILQTSAVLANVSCRILTDTDELLIQNIPVIFEFNVPYTVLLASNETTFLSHTTLNIEHVDTSFNTTSSVLCNLTNQSSLSYIYKKKFILKFEKNSTKAKCIQLKLDIPKLQTDINITHLCTNSSIDKILDNDDKYDVQSYMRTINTTDIALLDNFNWLIFGPQVREIWYTHEGMRLGRECDAAEDGRVAIFNNPRGNRRLISRPIDITNAWFVYMRLGSGTCPPPAPTDPPFQLLFTTDCISYSNWLVVHSQQILPGTEHITIPLSLNNITNSSTVCLKIEQNGDRFVNSGSWFIDDFIIVRSRREQEYFFDVFKAMQTSNWYRLVGGHLKTCDGRMSMVFESHPDIRTEIGATTIDFPLNGIIDYDHDALFYLSKNTSIDWTKWNATGFMNLNRTCTEADVITFNEENHRQLCSPVIELNRIDSILFTLSTEPCTKRNKQISPPTADIFLSMFYNGSSVAYARTIHRISLRDISQTYKTFHIRFDELRHSTTSYGRICLSQYHQSSGKNADVWSVRNFVALPLLQSNITHYIQLGLNTKCNVQEQLINAANVASGSMSSQTITVEYSVDFGNTWHLLLHPCFRHSVCSPNMRQIYSSTIVLPFSGWHRITLPLPIAILTQEYVRFRIQSASFVVPAYSADSGWALDQVFIGRCPRACSGHGWCQYNSCKCDAGFSGAFCEQSRSVVFNRLTFFMDDRDNQTDLMTYQGGRLSYRCDVISEGKALVFSKSGFRFLRLSNINGSTPKLVEFTLRLGSSNAQCFGTSKSDPEHDSKSILLLSSCSNGVHWTIVDFFRISDILAPDFRILSRVLFKEKPRSDSCLIEWRQMMNSGENQDVWAIDDIMVRDIVTKTSIKKLSNTKNFQTKLTYIRPGYMLSVQLEQINRKEPKSSFSLDDIQLQINSSQINISNYTETFSYQSDNSTLTIIITLPHTIWYKHVILNLTIQASKRFSLNSIHFGVPCENNCWLNGVCLEGMCLYEQSKAFNQLMPMSFNEHDLFAYKINAMNSELLLPLMDSTDISAIHFQAIADTKIRSVLTLECSPNGGMKWFQLGIWTEAEIVSFTDYYMPLSTVCQAKRMLFRWTNSSVQILNVAFVKSQVQHYFMDEFQKLDTSKWLYSTYLVNSSGLYTNTIYNSSPNKTRFQLISTAITLKQHDYVIMIDTNSNMSQTRLQIDYSLDNMTWHELFSTNNYERPMNRFGRQIPSQLLRRTIVIRVHSNRSFNLNHIYIGPPCPANCYGRGKCLWRNDKALCQCDSNQTSTSDCSQDHLLLSSIYETFENKLNSSVWFIPSHVQVTHRCYNRQSKTTPYLCFLPTNYTRPNYAIIGPFKKIKYVVFKFGLQYIGLNYCSNQVLFQYSYDNGIRWHTKKILDETNNVFERFDDLTINTHIYLRWIEENGQHACLMWNLRSISVRTNNDDTIWFENNLYQTNQNKTQYEAQTWEFPPIRSSSIIQFDLQMFPLKTLVDATSWYVSLEISSNVLYGWSSWMPLIPPCNQTSLYCEDRVLSTGSYFLAELYQHRRNVTIPIPDNYANQEVRFRWIASQINARFMINKVYVGADCPWFCSGHGLCQTNGCQCNHGYVLPFCSPDPSTILKGELLPMKLNANLSDWFEIWGYEKCSSADERYVFSSAGTRGLVSSEISLAGMKFIRIELDACFNRTRSFIEPIHVQISSNNGILWKTLMTIIYYRESPYKPWLIELPVDEAMKLYLVRLRLYQQASTKWTSNWILHKFEMIPQKLSEQWSSTGSLSANICNYKHWLYPLEIYSTVDIELNKTSFLTFQLEINRMCTNGLVKTLNHSEFYLQYSIDYGQTWSPIDRLSTIASNTNDIIVTQPLHAIKNTFYVPLHAYSSLSKFIRIRWLALNSTIATRWKIANVMIRPECEILCDLDMCNGKCVCPNKTKCFLSLTKTTFFERFNASNSKHGSDTFILPQLNLISTRFIEFSVQTSCQQYCQTISIEYSRNMGLSWHLFKYFTFNTNQSHIVHEDLVAEMKYDYVLVRFTFLSTVEKCLKLEHIAISGSDLLSEAIYGKFDRFQNFNPNVFISFGNGIFNGTYLMFPATNKTNSITNEIITDDLNIFDSTFYIQLVVVPLLYNRCINIQFSFSSDNGYTWQSIDISDVILFHEHRSRRWKMFTWKLTSAMVGSNQVRFRITFNDEQLLSYGEQFVFGISELYIGANCINSCYGRGMCLGNGRCRCDTNWTNGDCSLSLMRFPNELNVLKYEYHTSYGVVHHSKCGHIFNNTYKREFETNYIDVNHEHTYVHIELNDQCMSKTQTRKNGDGWIRLQYREMNSHEWITLHIFKDQQLNIIKLLPPYILQLRLIQDTPIVGRSPWSVEQFNIFNIHSRLQWFSFDGHHDTMWNSTFLRIINTTTEIIHEIKDVYFNSDFILQIEFSCVNSTKNIVEYSLNFGLTWSTISDESELQIVPIKLYYGNTMFYRLTIPFSLFSMQNDSIRFRFKFPSNCTNNQLQYIYVGNACPMNCFGSSRCFNGECQIASLTTTLVDFREPFERDFNPMNWLQVESYRHERNKILWTTNTRQALTRPIDLRPMRAIKWTYIVENLSKACHTSLYLLISTDGTMTWSVLHQFNIPLTNASLSNTSVEFFVELNSINAKYPVGQFRWYQPPSSNCYNFTWGLSRIISIKSINNYFLSDYFYALSSSRSNWEFIDGAVLAQPDQCNNNILGFIFHEKSFSAVTIPILIQQFYVLVFQFNKNCHQNTNIKTSHCRNLTSVIEYRTDLSQEWIQLIDMGVLACRTSLINGGYFNMHTIKLPSETYSSGTQFRWIGTQTDAIRWSMNSLFIGECPNYCHYRGLCTVSGCQCSIGYSGTYCEQYIGKEPLPTWFNETFDELSVGVSESNFNNWIRLSGDGHIRHVCSKNNTTNYLNGQALHFGAACGCGNVEAITRELNISQAKTISFAFHVTTENNCVMSTDNITVALEWTYDEGISWWPLMTMYNQQQAQLYNIKLSSEMIVINEKHNIGGIRFRWTQIERAANNIYWAIDNIRLE